MKKSFEWQGDKNSGSPYHYTGCGLDDIYLVNGYQILATAYGDSVSIEDAEGLHKAIAHDIVCNRALLNGREIRFLRSLMDMTQGELAAYLRCDPQSVARWEKGQDISGAADGIIRLLYLCLDHTRVDAGELLKQIIALDDHATQAQLYEETPDGWKQAA